jgi:hypothetical protein|eukprot:Tamp_25703.p1 GENE.Tamp_25703~~Tamp_25703.p1  ORF type:complete len:263 (-),score=38.01 Tamp_25703:140-928(-)
MGSVESTAVRGGAEVPGPEIEITSNWGPLLQQRCPGGSGGASSVTASAMHPDVSETWVLTHLLTEDECAHLVAEMEIHGFGTTNYSQAYRGNLRLQTVDASLAAALWARMCDCVPHTVELAGATWRAVGLNERFRLSKYRQGDRFCVHKDAFFRRPRVEGREEEWSAFTVNVYLNQDFEGGKTRFYDAGARRGAVDPIDHLIYALEPATGTACVFRQPPGAHLLHDGEAVSRGFKYLLRTDVMYRRLPGSEGKGRGEGVQGA